MSLEENLTGERKHSEEGNMSTLKEHRHKRRGLTVPQIPEDRRLWAAVNKELLHKKGRKKGVDTWWQRGGW